MPALAKEALEEDFEEEEEEEEEVEVVALEVGGDT